jgi:hypothetical protein
MADVHVVPQVDVRGVEDEHALLEDDALAEGAKLAWVELARSMRPPGSRQSSVSLPGRKA